MRSLGVILWCALFLGLSDAQNPDCKWQIPKDILKCDQIIKWKAHSDEQATATCLEYFPTTFVDGEVKGDEVKCTVYRQFQCNFIQDADGNFVDPDLTFSIFDKCFYFKDTTEVTLKDYDANPSTYCPGDGKLPIFFSMSQAKHIAKRANMKGIAKMWVNLDRNGKLIEDSHSFSKGFMLHKNLWKVHKDSWWDGEKLEKSTPGPDGPVVSDKAKNVFFRTDTDYVRNLWQGQFEITTQFAKATVICEYHAKIVPEQERYCKKMGKDGLGLNAVYDTKNGRKRCLYDSLTKYPMKGTKEAIQNFPGCKEVPSNEQLSGLDDGTASKSAYDQLTSSGTYRVAAIMVDAQTLNNNWRGEVRKKSECTSSHFSENHRQPYVIFDRFMKQWYSGYMSSKWAAGYPKNECSDFPDGEMDSNTLAISYKEIIDVPVPVHFKAICSIESNVDCQRNPNICRKDDQQCTNVVNWNKDTKLYAECSCVKFHTESNQKCEWNDSASACGKIISYNENNWRDVPTGVREITHRWADTSYDNNVVGVVVRKGCTMSVWSFSVGTSKNFPLVGPSAGYGQYDVPNHSSGTFNGDTITMDARGMECYCPFLG